MKDYLNEGFFFIYALGTLEAERGKGLAINLLFILHFLK